MLWPCAAGMEAGVSSRRKKGGREGGMKTSIVVTFLDGQSVHVTGT